MDDLKRYRVTGVSKSTGADARVEFEALNEANARVKAELREIMVTSVEQITHRATPSTERTSPPPEPKTSLQSDPAPEPAPRAPVSQMTPVPPPRVVRSGASSRRGSSVPAAIGWVVFVLALLAAIGQWIGPIHRRDSAIEAVILRGDSNAIAGAIGFLLGSNILGVVGAMLGVTVFFVSRRSGGRALVILSLSTVVINSAGQFRPSSESLAGTGFPTTTTPQAKQAATDMSRMFDRAIPPPGEAPSVAADPVASSAVHGELAHLVKVMQDLMAGMLEDANEYQSGVLALRLESVLLPMRLDSAAEINDSRPRSPLRSGYSASTTPQCELA